MSKKLHFLSMVGSVLATSALMGQINSYQNTSVTPTLLNINTAAFPGTQAFSVVGSRDTLPLSPAFRFGGSADGAGMVKNSNGSFTLVVNHEDNFAVSRVILDSNFTPVSGEYLLNSNAGMWRLCSGTLVTPDVHGFGPGYLTCGESGAESMTHFVNIHGAVIHDSTTAANTTLARGLGRWSAENAVPLPLSTYNQTIILIGDDDSGPNGGQIAMYIANSVGDVQNGRLYVLRRTDLNQRERDIAPGQVYPIEFVEVPNATNLTGAQIDAYSSATLNCVEFQRVEDIDYRKGSPSAAREIYINATGAANADSVDRTVWGRVYRIVLDPNNPLVGTIECVINGDDKSTANPYRELYQPDNIVVTEDYVYVQEDPNGYSFPAALPYVHDARIYQYDIATGAFVRLVEFDHRRSATDSLEYNRNSAGTAYQRSNTGSWEYGAMFDLSNITGVQNSFMVALQPHTWRFPEFSGVDGGTLRPNEKQGSLMVVLTNVPRVKVTVPVVIGDTVCEGSSAVLSAMQGTTFYATNGTVYHWYTQATGGTPIHTGATFTTPVLTVTTTYYVETEASGTVSNARTPVTAVVVALPTTPVITQNGNQLVSSAANGNQWYRNGVIIPGATASTFTVIQDGYYTVIVTIGECSSAVSNEVFMNVTSIDETIITGGMTVFPNPNDGIFTVNYYQSTYTENLKLQVVNGLGQIVWTRNFNHYVGQLNADIDLTTMETGIYVITIFDGKSYYQQQILKK